MPCLAGVLALFTPRLLIAVLAIFTHYFARAYEGWLWPTVGFFFMPFTTLAYAFAVNSRGSVEGFYFALVLIAALSDLGLVGGGFKMKRWMRR